VHIAVLLMSGSDNFLDKAYIEGLGKGNRTSISREIAAEAFENGVTA
tara:strand:+ start:92 stop:232 length:141 start_codon:yes stop_codon:yes gene_type:complete